MVAGAAVDFAGASAQVTSMTPDVDTVLDPEPFSTSRAAGMGGALSTIADDHDAVYYNPAHIGGFGFDTQGSQYPYARALYFPYFGAGLNENARSVRNEFTAKQAQRDASTGAAIMDANSGKRQFARASIIPLGLLLGRTAILPVMDHQLAAVPIGENTGQVNMRYRSFTGALLGTSISDHANRFSIGASQSIGTIEETMGTFSYTDMVDSYQRKKILKENRKTYTAKSVNAGMTIRVPKAVTPTFSVVARNLGNTKNTATSSGDEPLIYAEDLTVGFSISPPIGRLGRFNLLVEGGYLTQKHMAARKKIRGGMELILGGTDGKSHVGIRAGGNDAGWSAGLHINLGLIGLEAESHAVDLGLNNQRVIERRGSAVIYFNIASF